MLKNRTVINETQNFPQNQNPGNNPNNPNYPGNFNPNNPRFTGQPYNQFGVTPNYLKDEENRTRLVTKRPESGRRESDEREKGRREEWYGD